MIVTVVRRRARGGRRRVRGGRPAAQQPGGRHLGRAASRAHRGVRLADRGERRRRIDHLGAVLDRPGAEQPDADALPARRRRVGRAVAVAARVPGERPARAGRDRDGHRPRRDSGVIGSEGQHLAQTVTSQFTVAPGSTLRLQQLLAELGYLPLTFTPASPLTSPTQEGNDQVGSFTWRWPNQPLSLLTLWTPGTNNVITQGAVMNFESQNDLKTDGIAGPQVWTDLLADVQSGKGDALPWDYVLVSQSLPESATVYKDGVAVYSTPVNTGVPGATTENGTFPVYARYTVTTMSGTNPDGSHYVDPGIPWVSYFNGGDALHGFPRASYGFPQSDGCVEMPISNAATVFPLTPLGTLVTVQA